MKSVFIILLTGVAALLLTACHSGAVVPHSYCHKLTTLINSYDHGGTTNRTNPAQRATLTKEYQSLDCDDQ
jgi:capsular polysaccharide biosynthesis protein